MFNHRPRSLLQLPIFLLALPVLWPGTLVAEENSLAGCWQGQWVSCTTGHRGQLRAQFCRVDEGSVDALFSGTFLKIIPFRYRATLQVAHEEPGLTVLTGSQRLGPLMGSFNYEATITDDQFKATYQSKRDHGHWSLTRGNR